MMSCKNCRQKKYQLGFTIIELLVVIVVIGVLAAITIISYSGIQNKAIASSLQLDLSSDAKLLKMYNIEHGYYPSSLDTNNCPLMPDADNRYCLKRSAETTLTYAGGDQAFKLKAKRGNIIYIITEGTTAIAATVPIVDNNTATNIASSSATLGATIVSDGGDDITDAGMCWGLTANPTTNCQSNEVGQLIPLSPATVSNSGVVPTFSSLSPDGKYVYMSNVAANSLSIFSRDLNSGLLTFRSVSGAGRSDSGGLRNVVISSDGKYAYIANIYSNTGEINIYSRNESDGTLTALPTSPIHAPVYSGSIKLALSPDGLFAYLLVTKSVTVYGMFMYSRDPMSGLLTILSPGYTDISTVVNDFTISPDGKSLYATNAYQSGYILREFSRNVANGQLSHVKDYHTPNLTWGVAVSPDGKSVYTTSHTGDGIYMFSRNELDGSLSALTTPVLKLPYGSYPTSIIISSDGASAYVVNANNSKISILSRDINSGELKLISTLANSTDLNSLVISPDGNNAYAGTNSSSVAMFRRNKFFGIGAFTQARTGLPSGTTIHYRGYATNGIGTGYSGDSTFTTP